MEILPNSSVSALPYNSRLCQPDSRRSGLSSKVRFPMGNKSSFRLRMADPYLIISTSDSQLLRIPALLKGQASRWGTGRTFRLRQYRAPTLIMVTSVCQTSSDPDPPQRTNSQWGTDRLSAFADNGPHLIIGTAGSQLLRIRTLLKGKFPMGNKSPFRFRQ